MGVSASSATCCGLTPEGDDTLADDAAEAAVLKVADEGIFAAAESFDVVAAAELFDSVPLEACAEAEDDATLFSFFEGAVSETMTAAGAAEAGAGVAGLAVAEFETAATATGTSLAGMVTDVTETTGTLIGDAGLLAELD